MSNHVQNTLDAINKIDVEVENAQEAVMESYVELGNKFDTMEKHGLPVASDDSTIQSFIDNRNEIITEYTNEGKKKANIKIIGVCNMVIPELKQTLDLLEKDQLSNRAHDAVNSQKIFDFMYVKRAFKNAKKSGEYTDKELETISAAEDAIDKWTETRKSFDKYVLYTRDTRNMSSFKPILKDLIEKLEAAKKMGESHYNGKEETNNG